MILKVPASIVLSIEYFIKQLYEVQYRKQIFKNWGCSEGMEPCSLAFPLT